MLYSGKETRKCLSRLRDEALAVYSMYPEIRPANCRTTVSPATPVILKVADPPTSIQYYRINLIFDCETAQVSRQKFKVNGACPCAHAVEIEVVRSTR
jgi:hypothetical protein